MKKSTRFITSYIAAYKCRLFLSLCLAAATSLLSLYIPRLTGQAVDLIVGPGKVDLSGLRSVLIKIALFAVLSGLSQYVMNLINNSVTFGVVKDIRNDAFKRIEKLPLKYLDKRPYGDIVSTMTADADQMADGLLMGFSQLFTGVVTILGTFLFMLLMDFRIALLVALLTPISFFAAKFIAGHSFRYARDLVSIRGEETSFVQEMIGGMHLVHAFNREDEVKKEFDAVNEELKEASLKATFFSSLVNPSTRFVNNLVYASVAVSGGFTVLKGLMSVGELVSFLSYASQYMKPFNEISGVITELQSARASAERLSDLISEETEIPDSEDALVLMDPAGQVDFKRVFFSYVPGQKLIEDFDLSVTPGERVAIVGPTGSGKTTLINLLMRFYDVDNGAVLIDGKDVRDITRESLRDSFGMVLQDTWLKSGTIRDNLTMGDDSITEEEMVEAAKLCHAHSFIRRLPEKYDTVIKEDGGGLSAGQKQLLCITRVMLSRPRMLILDEATSSIDTRTELKIQEAFNSLMKGRTSFIVAHRLSTIREADLILVMRDGHIVEQGSHGELLAQKGFYHHLLNSQFLGKSI